VGASGGSEAPGRPRRRHDCHEPAFAGDVERVDAENLAGARHDRPDRQRYLVKPDGDAGVASDTLAEGAEIEAELGTDPTEPATQGVVLKSIDVEV